jgi:hypothetical protein
MLKFVHKLFQISTSDVAQQNGSTSTTSLDKSKVTASPKLEEFDQNVITLTEQHSGIMHFSKLHTVTILLLTFFSPPLQNQTKTMQWSAKRNKKNTAAFWINSSLNTNKEKKKNYRERDDWRLMTLK